MKGKAFPSLQTHSRLSLPLLRAILSFSKPGPDSVNNFYSVPKRVDVRNSTLQKLNLLLEENSLNFYTTSQRGENVTQSFPAEASCMKRLSEFQYQIILSF